NIYLGGDKSVHYNTMKMTLPEAINHVRAKIISNPEMKVLIHADRNIPFSEVDAVFEKLKEIGATKISLVTQTNPGGG
ncbi:MAG TPA: biopolymer transporter ExbD, partial [Leptospiraceae bacterium]|nr:biopolymer transporter ExbD [Leptospiraceae bacterium]